MSEQKTSRPVWSGTIVLGQVAVPVSLYVAQQRDEISARTLHRDCSTPIKQKRWCDHCERDLASGETVRAFEFSPKQFVLLDDAELADPKTLELTRFVNVDDVPVLHLDRTYYVAPNDDDASQQAYAVLAAALEQSGTGGLGTFVMYAKEQSCLIRPIDGTLCLTTLFLTDDLRRPADTGPAAARARETKLAVKLIRDRAGSFDPRKLAGPGRSALRKTIDRKIAAGDTVTAANAAVAPVDLAAALRSSVKAAKPKRAPARK